MSVDPTFVVAASGAATAAAGVWLSNRGRKDTVEQSKAADALAEQNTELESWKALAVERAKDLTEQRGAAEREIAALRAAADQQSTRANLIEDRHDKFRQRCQEEQDRERAEHDRRVRELASTIAILRSAVLDEAKAEAAKDVVRSVAGIDDLDALIEES